MEVKTNQQIYDEIMVFLHNNGGEFKDWYVGIAADPEECLFKNHHVDKTKDLWICGKTQSTKDALLLKRIFVNKYKTNELQDNIDKNSVYFYAYKKKNGVKNN